MIIRRFVTALRQQDWGIAAVDFIIVVAGIFVGLQVDALVQERKDIRTGFETLSRLYEELDSQQRELENAVRNANFFNQHVDHLATISKDPESAGEQIKLTYEALAYSTYVSAYTLRTAVFETAMSQGTLDFVENQDLLANITRHYSAVEYWDKVILVFTRYRNSFDDALAGIGGMKWAQSDLDDPNQLAALTPEDAIDIGRALRDSPDVQKWLPRQWTYHAGVRGLAEARLASVTALQAEIATELNRGPAQFHIETPDE